MNRYLQNQLKPVAIEKFEPADLVRCVRALRENPVFSYVLYECVNRSRIGSSIDGHHTGLDGVIERSNGVIRNEALLTFDEIIHQIEEDARERMTETSSSSAANADVSSVDAQTSFLD